MFKKKMKISLDKGAFMPVRAYPTDAGLDLRTPKAVIIPAGGSAVIDTGVHVEFPKGTYGLLESKSGLNVKHDIVSLGGTIDENFRGSIKAKLYNLGKEDYAFDEGDKIVQMVIHTYHAPEIVVVEKLDDTDRGSNGFGSSGR